MSKANSIFDTIYNDYLAPFAHHATPKNKLIAPFVNEVSVNTIFLYAGIATLSILFLYAIKPILYVKRKQNEPPIVPYWIPFIGSAITMGLDPIKFYRKYQQEYGNYFTFILLGRRMVTCLGTEGNNFVFNAKLADASAEAAYKSLTVPVFGKGVVYDVHNSVLMEQKKFVKSGLSNENLRAYVPMIEMETKNYFSRWDKKSDIQDVHKAAAELIIMTASKCLLGDEVRSKLDESFAQIFHDLDGGFKPVNFLFDDLPLPSNKLRDQAHVKMRNFFMDIMKDRREKGITDRTDIMQYLTTNCQYKSGKKLSDEESAHIMIAMLMAGQHTSSTTTAWALLYLAARPTLFNELRQEQIDILGSLHEPLTFDAIKKLTLHDNVVRETLRLRPPILNIIRKVLRDLPIPGTQYVVPKDSYIQSVLAVSHRSEGYFESAETFNPNRWIDFDQNNKERDDDLVDYGFGVLHRASAKSPFLPFGAGRHRCIGEPFAYVQIKTIIAVFVRMFDLALHENTFPECDFTSMIVQPKSSLVQYTKRDN
ncbi:lanosterol 14-alpha demethylase [Glomus cerebriforme]|uniref:Lanosterol 14-alpha demethylase n=1 Tax=Glomus cerebriforme TaxID=658196 RepID=A0A397TKQ8_9GLOM|nr:lanosterol 14-alpha demethylase [Glomus cerebriforme]